MAKMFWFALCLVATTAYDPQYAEWECPGTKQKTKIKIVVVSFLFVYATLATSHILLKKIVVVSFRFVYFTLATSHILLKNCLNTAGRFPLLYHEPV